MSVVAERGDRGEADHSWSLSPESIRAAVERIVASPDFVASDRARNFLRYVVEETLGGRSDRIKAFSVAVEVFGRDETFDAQNDPVVRIEAGRLRRALERYYLLGGRNDPVRIEIPKGGYVPVFEERPAVPAGEAAVTVGPALDPPVPAAAASRPKRLIAAVAALAVVGALAWHASGMPPFGARQSVQLPAGPSVMVLPFADLGEGGTSALYSAALTDEIVTALARFKEVTVFGVQTSRSVGPDGDVARLHDEFKVQYVLEGAVRADDDRIRVNSRLLDAANGAVLWSRNDQHPLTAADLFAIPATTAEEVAAAVAEPYGIVFQAETAREPSRPPDDLEAYLCTLRYYVYRASPSPDGHAAVRDCLERAVALFPNYATAWSVLALVHVDEARHDLNPRPGAPDAIERALAAGREAVRLDARNPRSLQSLATALFYGHQVEEAFEVGERAVALNPNDTEVLGQIGQLFGLAGRFDEGRALLEQAIHRNPAHAGFYRGVLATIAYMQYDYDTALVEIERANARQLPIYYGVAAIIYAQKGLVAKAEAALREFERLLPDFVPNLWAELDSRNIPPKSQLHMADGLRKAGAIVPPAPQGLPAPGGQSP